MISYKELGLVNTTEMFAKAVKGGATYLKSMQANLEVLKKALN